MSFDNCIQFYKLHIISIGLLNLLFSLTSLNLRYKFLYDYSFIDVSFVCIYTNIYTSEFL